MHLITFMFNGRLAKWHCVSFPRVSVENQILKSGFTSRELIILENDDPGGVFEFASSSRGPYRIKVSPQINSTHSRKAPYKNSEFLYHCFVLKEGESVELHIVRSRGALIKQFLRYTVEPRDCNEFYGSTGILEFKPGEREIKLTLLTRMDGIPEVKRQFF